MLTEDQLKYLFSLPPDQIVKWYQSKGTTFSWDWKEVWQEAHSRSFTVAKVMKLDILQELRDEVDKIFTEGITYEQFQKDLEPILRRLGWWGKVPAKDVPGYDPANGIDPEKIVQLGSPYRLNTIFTTNANVGYSKGRYDTMIQNTVERPYWMYKQIERLHKRRSHAIYANKVFMWNDPIWNHIYPPNGFNCGCYIIALNKQEMESLGLHVSNGADFPIEVGDGWDYNPAITNFKPDLSNYDSDLRNEYRQS
jgi:uncharacterized protein with gpF-like domain